MHVLKFTTNSNDLFSESVSFKCLILQTLSRVIVGVTRRYNGGNQVM